jgi:hypothetical protein
LDVENLDLKYANQDGADSDETVDSTDGPANWDPLVGSSDPPHTDGGPAGTDPIDELLKQIPGLTNDFVRDGVRQVYEAIPPQSREAFLQELRNAGPSFVFSVLQRWQAQPPPGEPGSTQNVGYVRPAPETRQSLVAAIAGLLARSFQERTAYEQSIAAGLAGLPDKVSLGVLADWHADLTDRATDPDPKTSAETSLDQRIIRQLTIQRVSVYQLSQELRERLMQARQQ